MTEEEIKNFVNDIFTKDIRKSNEELVISCDKTLEKMFLFYQLAKDFFEKHYPCENDRPKDVKETLEKINQILK